MGKLYEELGDTIGSVELVEHMGSDLQVVNAARVSFGVHKDELDDRDKKLLKYLANHQHTSPFEHNVVTFLCKVPLFVRSQHHRHRTWCLSGDTEVTFNRPEKWRKGIHSPQSRWNGEKFTMRSLHEMWNKNEHSRNTLKKMLVRVFDEESRKFGVSSVVDVIHSGTKEVFEIETSRGKSLKLTKDHKILTENGWQTLEAAIGLSVSSTGLATLSRKASILTNGVSVWQSFDWMKTQRENGLSVQEIADEAGCSYHTIRKWLKIHNLKFDQKEVLRQFNRKHGVWNKGKRGYRLNRTPMSPEHREAIRQARSGPNSNFWKGGISSERKNIARWTRENARKVHEKFDFTCQKCGVKGVPLHAHHVLPVVTHPEEGRNFDNLLSVCVPCHRKIHEKLPLGFGSRKGAPLGGRFEEITKVRLVGVEEVFDLSIEGPSHNFVANGMVVHNCFNEISRRYSSENLEFYGPTLFRPQHQNNRQASVDEPKRIWLSDGRSEAAETIHRHHVQSVELFNRLLEAGVCREQARGVLPQNLYTSYYATVNLHNLFKFYCLRTHEGAQWEIRRVAEEMSELVKPLFPLAWQALLDAKG
jgi:thymidylate synthase (FAD)